MIAVGPEPAERPAPPRDLWILCATFFCIFLGGGALQQHLNTILAKTRGWDALMISSVLATVYGTFAVWRIFIGYSMRLLGRRLSIFFGTLTYALLPFASSTSTSLAGCTLRRRFGGGVQPQRGSRRARRSST